MSLDLIINVLFLYLFCLVLASMESQIEGSLGWAEGLPTWRPKESTWYVRLYGKLMGGKKLTGYHLMVFSLVFLFLHYPFFAGKTWNLSLELTILSLFFIVIVVWDFLWFVINPKYDFLDFWAKKVWWHKKWFLHLPRDYWYSLIISAVFYMQFSLSFSALREWFFILFLFLVPTLITMLFADLGGILRKK